MGAVSAASAPSLPRPALRAEPLSRAFAWWLFAVAIVLLLALSAPTLEVMGVPYESPFGPGWAKLHPATYLLALAWFTALASHGNPLGELIAQFRRNALITIYFICMVVVFCWVVARHGTSGAAYIIQTLWMPAMAVFTLELLPTHRRQQIGMVVVVFMAFNSAVAIGEYVTHSLLLPIPRPVGDTDFFRPQAFLGHPLFGAKFTVVMLPVIVLMPWSNAVRIGLIVLSYTAVLAFGGRSALILGTLVYAPLAVYHVARKTFAGGFSYLQLTGGAIAFAMCAAGISLLVALTGIGDRIIHNLVWDNSAQVRAQVWSAFGYLHGMDWWIGVSPREIDRIALAMGLDPRYEAIENFWIYMYMQFGAVGYLPFLVALAGLIALNFKTATPAMVASMIAFFCIASTANSLSSKSLSLTFVAMLSIGSLAASRRPAAAAARWRSLALQPLQGAR